MFNLKEKEERCPHLLAVRGAQILHRERDVWIRGRFWKAAQEWKNAPPSQKKAYGPIAYNSSQDWPWSVSQAFSLGIQVRKTFLSPLIQRAVSPIKKIEQIYIWDAMTTDYLFFSPSEWNFCRWRSDVLPGETFLSASGVERLLLSQTNRELWSKALFFKKPQTPVLKP